MTDYQYKAGDKGLCRDGETAYEVIAVMPDGNIVVWIPPCTDYPQGLGFFTLPDGRRNLNLLGEHGLDLTPPRQEIERWVNVYKGGVDIFVARRGADNGAHPSRIACIPITIRFTPGEGLE